MTPTVYVNGKQIPFPPLFHLHQLGLVEVTEGQNGVQPVTLTEAGKAEVQEVQRVQKTVERLKTFKQLELVTP